MKSIKKYKPKTPTILQEQSSKIKEKLELLRQQVNQKRQQKQMTKTATSIQNTKSYSKNTNVLSSTTLGNMNVQNYKRLNDVLTEIKLETLEDKLKQKGIRTIEMLLQLSQEEIDSWKDVAVGWRIKLKKNIRGLREKTQNNKLISGADKMNMLKNNSLTKPPQIQAQSSSSKYSHKDKDIEEIIRQRKQQKRFFPIFREIQQPNQYYEPSSMPQQDQDIIIQSFMKVFQPRKGILGRNSKILKRIINQQQIEHTKKQSVKWSIQVEQMEKKFERKSHKTYPKQTIQKDVLIPVNEVFLNKSQQKYQKDPNYCWKCFKRVQRVDQKTQETIFCNQKQNKNFCDIQCEEFYNNQQKIFKNSLQQHEEQMKKSFTKTQSDQKQSSLQQEQELQTIDLTIL